MSKFLSYEGLTYFYNKLVAKFVAQESGKGLSTNDYTTTEKTKLAGIADGANAYTLPNATATSLGGVKVGANITVASGVISLTKGNVTDAMGYTPPTTDTNTTYSISKTGSTVTLTGSDGSKSTFTDADTTYEVATTSANGLMSSGNVTKLNGISAGAQVNVIESVKVNGTALSVTSKAVNIDLSSYALKSDITTAYLYKGSVNTYADLPTSPSTGWVYNVVGADAANNIKAGDNVAWNGTAWDNLSGIVDLSNYYTKSEVDAKEPAAIATTEIDSMMAS